MQQNPVIVLSPPSSHFVLLVICHADSALWAKKKQNKTKQNKTKQKNKNKTKKQSYRTTMSYVSLQLLHVMIGIFSHFNQKQKPKMLMHGYQVNMRTHMTWLLIARSNEVTDYIITDGSLKWPGAILIHSQNDRAHIITVRYFKMTWVKWLAINGSFNWFIHKPPSFQELRPKPKLNMFCALSKNN